MDIDLCAKIVPVISLVGRRLSVFGVLVGAVVRAGAIDVETALIRFDDGDLALA